MNLLTPTSADQRGLTHSKPETADSPCVAVCSTLFDDVCRGCGRTIMEVSDWVFMSDADKQAVWVRIRAEGYPRRG